MENLKNNIEKIEKMKAFLDEYNEYVLKEFGIGSEFYTLDDVFANDGLVGIAYTTSPECDDVEVQVVYDLLTETMKFSVIVADLGSEVRRTYTMSVAMDYDRAVEFLDFGYAVDYALDYFKDPVLLEGIHYNV